MTKEYAVKCYIFLLEGDDILEEHKVPMDCQTPLNEVISSVIFRMQSEFNYNSSLSILVKPCYKDHVLPF